MSATIFFQQLSNGISLGSLYALVAIGYTMVYGILRLINFAHGDLLMVASYTAIYAVTMFSLPWYLSFPLAIALTGCIGILMDKVAYKPLRDAPRISLLISAIGASFLLENLALVIIGGIPKGFPRPEIFAKVIEILGVRVQVLTIYIPIMTLVFLMALLYIVYRTKVGKAMRAASKDIETTRLMGINVDRIIALTFLMGSSLAAAGGIMWALKYPQVNPFMGVIPGLKAFIAAVLGGIGDIIGAVVGGFVLGLGEILLVAFFPELAQYRDAFAFVLLILVLLFRPTGIMGEPITDKT
ncbi:amino acid/amide ABC transporter membrane protein 1, HAAT family [Desulfacinum hydrothermale DSM 13146]|uniref:Amino acid/amide ABC transporter membrane protein 1, HAAT family n=1 Tax=Desulfacinum hydrothermale DSM 13146 TaxID=1121390 RepID=A0A1W1X4S5_9BACT|nr:branched-chain amino acid ABC transporter permease [Desulfacinum hydrothermale]SMC18959.1 amino acid/amide ABC transporter membrane protein 1, HAAT family [Desulfacinum hydrothermale DSM 13146]